MYDTRGLEVFIHPIDSDGNFSSDEYQEWTAPRHSNLGLANAARHGPNVAYITPGPGERFAVQVFVHPVVSYQDWEEFNIECFIDGTAKIHETIERYPRPKRGEGVVIRNSRSPRSWTSCGLQFAEIRQHDDPSLMTADEEEIAVDRRGKIEVKIQRGRTISRKRRRRGSGPSVACEDEVIKTVSKDHRTSHITKPIADKVESHEPSARACCYTAAGGAAVEAYNFTIYYTSREYLEIYGVIPTVEYPGRIGEAVVLNKRYWAAPSTSGPAARAPRGRDVASTDRRPAAGADGRGKAPMQARSESPGSKQKPEDEREAFSLGSSEAPSTPLNTTRARAGNLYERTPSRFVRGATNFSEDFTMYGGLGRRIVKPKTPLRTPGAGQMVQNSDGHAFDERSQAPSTVTHGSSRKRKTAREQEAAEREIEHAELALAEIQAKKRLLAARIARDSLWSE